MVEFFFRMLAWLGRKKIRLASQIHALRFRSCGRRPTIREPQMLLGTQYISIGDDFDCFPRLRLEAFDQHQGVSYTPRIDIGDGVSINYDCHIGCVGHISIGNRVLIASRVFITDHSHGAGDYADINTPPAQRQVHFRGGIVIEDDVWIGEGACILPGVRIGRASIIGANSVVTRDVPPWSIVAGAPAKVIRHLK